MVLFNYATRELTAKIVYYGPGLCGKTTNLEFIHKTLPDKTRGKMLSLATQTDRTLFFDFLPLDLGSVKGMKTRVQLYTVPGQVFYDATRKLVLKGADGIVFVVDSQKEMMQSNLDSWENLKANLAENNLDISAMPVVIQYNKRDLPNVLPVKDLNKKINVLKAPSYEAVALTGLGVPETFKGIAKIVMNVLAKKYGRPEEVASIAREEAAEIDRVRTAEARALQSDRTLDLSDLEEEIHELPQTEEIEVAEESSLSLEPIETHAASEEILELQEVNEEAIEVPAPTVPAPAPAPPPAAAPAAVSRPASSPSIKRVSSPAISIPDFVKSIPVRKPAPRPDQETELVPDETVHASRAKVSSDQLSKDIPIEISVSREGQDIKLNISLHLRIRINKD